ncbi:helix-turn-helix domain-containing protein [Natronospirillum operosum]|nr:helix-turn-helix domain-containing protein [Natronospirillum operosum]
MTILDSTTKALLRDPAKRRAWVVYQVAIQGTSLAAVAREKGLARQTLYRAFDIPYPRMEKIMADAVGLTPQQLFPERYTKDGLPARRMGRPKKSATKKPKDTTPYHQRNVDNGERI